MLWFAPLHLILIKNTSWLDLLQILHGYELTLSDGLYFYFLNFLFGLRLQYFIFVSLFLHLFNSLMLFNFLRTRLKISFDASFVAALIFLAFYGQFHVYVWPLAAHHLIAIFFIFTILNLYFCVEDKVASGGRYRAVYGWTLAVSLLSSFLRLSILAVPVMIFAHLLLCAEDRRRVLEKYDRWLPLFIIFTLYPVWILISGKQAVLELVFEPFYELLEGRQNLPTALGGMSLCIGILFVVREILRRVSSGQIKERAIKIIRWLLILIFLMSPQFLYLALRALLNPLESALSENTLKRWQPIDFPVMNGAAIAGIILLVTLLLFFIFYALRQNKHLIIFVVWYIFLIPYLGSRPEFIYSRYLVFISPLLALMFALFFVEFLPQQLPGQWRQRWRIGFYIFIFLLLTSNVLAIKLRLFRTTLVDYHWSYDYIKISRLIKQDLRKREVKDDQMICVSGVQEIPYATGWKKGFLSFFHFDYYSPFCQTLSSTLEWPMSRVMVREACPDSAVSYFVNDYTVLDEDKKNIEPFYQYYEKGLEFLNHNDPRQAIQAFQEARKARPFLFQFLTDSFISKIFGEGLTLFWTSQMIEQITLRYYDGDPKINYINAMVQKESQDYGMILTLLAYFQFRDGHEEQSKNLFKEALLFVSKEELSQGHPFYEYFAVEQRREFDNFIKNYGSHIGFSKRVSPGLDIEIYRGFMIHWFNNAYFAWPHEEGDFNLGKLRQKQYSHIFTAETKRKLRKVINELIPLKQLTGSPRGVLRLPAEIVYKNYKIIRRDEDYFIVAMDKNFSLGVGDKQDAFIKVRSLTEAKLIIDTAADL